MGDCRFAVQAVCHVLLLGCTGIWTSAVGAQDIPALLKEAYEKTQAARNKDQLDEVIKLTQSALQHDLAPEMADYGRRLLSWAHNRKGEMLAEEGEDEAAIAEFELAVSLEPGRWKAAHNLAVSLAQKGDLERALRLFNEVLALKRDYPNAWYNRGETYYAQGNYAAALRDYEQAIRLDSNMADYHASRGHVLFLSGRITEAVTACERALGLEREHVGALVTRGDIRNYLGQYAQALADYRRAIEIDPNSARGHRGLAWLQATCPVDRFRNPSSAIATARKAVALAGESDYHYLDTLAAALASAGQFAEAIELQSRVVQAAPEKELEFLQRRLAYYEDGKPYRETRAAPSPQRSAPAEPPRRINRLGRR